MLIDKYKYYEGEKGGRQVQSTRLVPKRSYPVVRSFRVNPLHKHKVARITYSCGGRLRGLEGELTKGCALGPPARLQPVGPGGATLASPHTRTRAGEPSTAFKHQSASTGPVHVGEHSAPRTVGCVGGKEEPRGARGLGD